MSQLKWLDLTECNCLCNLNPLGNLRKLRTLNLRSCGMWTGLILDKLKNIPLLSCEVERLSDQEEMSALCCVSSLRELTLLESRSVDGLDNLSNLEYLDLSVTGEVQSITPLSSLTKLTRLKLKVNSSSNITDFGCLASLTNLTTLELPRSKVSSVKFLRAFSSLDTLDLSGSDQLKDLSPLTSLTALKTVNLGGCAAITDGTALTNLPCLAELNLESTSIRTIPLNTSLEVLTLADCKFLADCSTVGWSVLLELTQLRTLDLSQFESGLPCVPPLPTSLQHLDLSFCDDLVDITALSSLCNLVSLNLEECGQLTGWQQVVAPLVNLRTFTDPTGECPTAQEEKA